MKRFRVKFRSGHVVYVYVDDEQDAKSVARFQYHGTEYDTKPKIQSVKHDPDKLIPGS